MNTQTDRAKEIFLNALEIADVGDRFAFLDRECAGSQPLRREVDDLLAHHERVGSFLATIPRHPHANETPPFVETAATEGPGATVGHYHLLEQLGEGGMGLVFVAQQTEPVRRRVALKLIKPGMDSRQVVARFEVERQALALMDHPNIATVLDAGTTDDGRPYFVMELVRGAPITAYCDQSHLTVRARLALFVQVCQAVQHAHQKGIIHRDIKPSNVLVTEQDGKPVAKVIDFGIAKAVGQQLTDKTVYTRFMQLVGTPLYMSPEQAGLSAQDVDTRTDVYSLGVLLYELLTSTTPFDRERMRTMSFDEFRRIIREEEPARPSARLSTLNAAASTVSANRGTDVRRLSREVRGELDWVVMKALEKDRNRRYESAAAFAADVQRYLDDEPVQACPPSAGYRLQKLVRRNKIAVGAASVLAAVLLLAIAGQAVNNYLLSQAKKDTENALEQKSKEEKEKDAALNDREAALKLKDQALKDKEAALKQKEEQRITAERNKEEALANLGEARQAVKVLLLEVAMNFHFQGIHNSERSRLLSKAIPVLERFVKQKVDAPDILAEQGRAYDDLSLLRSEMGQPLQALADSDHAVAIFRHLCGEHAGKPEFRTELALVLSNRAKILGDLRRFDPAEKAEREALDVMEKLVTEFPPEPKYREHLGLILNNLGILLRETDRAEAAVTVHNRCVATRRQLVKEHDGAVPARVLSAQGWLEVTLVGLEAVKRAAILRLQLAQAYVSLGGAHHARREFGQAEGAYEEARKILDHETLVPRQGDQELARAISIRGMVANNLGALQLRTGRHADALESFREAIRHKDSLASQFPSIPRYRFDLAGGVMNLGNVLSDMNRWDDAQKAYDRAVRLYELLVRDFPTVPEFAVGLAGAYGNQAKLIGDRGGLEKSLPKLDLAIAALEPFLRNDERDVKVRDGLHAAYHVRAVTLCGLGRHRDARPDWDRAVELAPANELLNDRSKRASNLLNLGEFERALDDIRAIAESPKANGEYLFIAASGYAVVSAATRDKALAEARAARAVVLLREAMVKGYHFPPDRLNQFADLRALHGREDFQKLMRDEESICREAIKLTPKDPVRHYNLAHVLHDKGQVPETISYLKKAIELRADYGEAHEMLGYVLDGRGDRAGAEVAYREAIKHYKDKDNTYRALCNLAGVIGHQQRQPEAATLFRQAIDLLPRRPTAHFGLGTALGEQGRTQEAIDALRDAVECDEKAPNGHANLGFALLLVGEYTEAKTELKRCHDLIPADHPLRARMRQLMADCDRLGALAERLPALLEGKDKPANAVEGVAFGEVCLAKGLHATSTRLYAESFRDRPQLATGRRYNAARAAVLAASAPRLPFGLLERQRAAWRELALNWLLEETDTWEKLIETPQGRARILKDLLLWQRNPDFAGVRDKDELARLPAGEQRAWRQFWSDLEAVLTAVKPKTGGELPKTP